MRIIVFLLLLNFGCSKSENRDNKEAVLKMDTLSNQILNKNKMSTDDTLYLSKNGNINSLFELNEDGKFSIDSLQIKLVLSENKKGKYDMALSKNDKIILIKKDLEGISKINLSDGKLCFSIYQTFTEDGQNQGSPIIYLLKENKVLTNSKQYDNTCNPISGMNNNFYVVQGLSIVELDNSLNFKRNIPINYVAKNMSNTFLDTFLICGIEIEKNIFHVDFSPQKSEEPCSVYSGKFNSNVKKIVLLDN